MDVQNDLRPTKPSVKTRDFAGETLVLGHERGIRVGLPPTPLGEEAGDCRVDTLLSPHEQVRRVEALATEPGAELSQLCALGVSPIIGTEGFAAVGVGKGIELFSVCEQQVGIGRVGRPLFKIIMRLDYSF